MSGALMSGGDQCPGAPPMSGCRCQGGTNVRVPIQEGATNTGPCRPSLRFLPQSCAKSRTKSPRIHVGRSSRSANSTFELKALRSLAPMVRKPANSSKIWSAKARQTVIGAGASSNGHHFLVRPRGELTVGSPGIQKRNGASTFLLIPIRFPATKLTGSGAR